MIRANVYVPRSLAAEHEVAIETGIELVCGYIGQAAAIDQVEFHRPPGKKGPLTYKELKDYDFDPSVALHMFAAPLDMPGAKGALGVSLLSRGLLAIDMTEARKVPPSVLKAATSHETAHALGFVRKEATQNDQTDKHHCVNGGCVMSEVLEWETFAFASIARRTLTRKVGDESQAGKHQTDFCTCCQQDLSTYGEFNLMSMFEARERKLEAAARSSQEAA